MTLAGLLLLALVSAILIALAYRPLIWNGRRKYLAGYRFPDAVIKRFSSRHPELNDKEVGRVQQGMFQYFEICQRTKGRFVSMPSQVVDDLWHEFILFTRNYDMFCRKAFGKYLHHTPVEAMAGPMQATSGIRRTWFHACRMENINPKDPKRLPLLFALDAQLSIADGFFYRLNCRDAATSSSNAFCASDIGCGTGGSCGSGASCGGDGGSGDAGGHGGGDGGHGCGGGSGCGSGCGGGCGGGGD